VKDVVLIGRFLVSGRDCVGPTRRAHSNSHLDTADSHLCHHELMLYVNLLDGRDILNTHSFILTLLFPPGNAHTL